MEINNERTHNIYSNSPQKVNERFCKDEYIYLLKGGSKNHLEGFKSRLFLEKGLKLKDCTDINLEQAAFYQTIGMTSPFISVTTDFGTAQS